MHRALLLSAVVLAGYVTAASAQQPPPAQRGGIKLSDVAGTWDGKTMIGPKDSVIATYTQTATADTTGWTLKFPTRDPYPARIVAMGGDSIVTEVGPYLSILRQDTVTVLRTTGHYKGDTMTGTFWARYKSGDVLSGKIVATRKK